MASFRFPIHRCCAIMSHAPVERAWTGAGEGVGATHLVAAAAFAVAVLFPSKFSRVACWTLCWPTCCVRFSSSPGLSLVLLPCPSARFGRTWGLSRGDLRIPPWGHSGAVVGRSCSLLGLLPVGPCLLCVWSLMGTWGGGASLGSILRRFYLV